MSKVPEQEPTLVKCEGRAGDKTYEHPAWGSSPGATRSRATRASAHRLEKVAERERMADEWEGAANNNLALHHRALEYAGQLISNYPWIYVDFKLHGAQSHSSPSRPSARSSRPRAPAHRVGAT